MTSTERFQVALIRVQSGETIAVVIKNLYTNRRGYTKSTTKSQRAEIGRARTEYLECQKDKTRNRYPRLHIETTAERRQAVEQHCKENGLTVARFVNSAIAEALQRSKRNQ